MACEKVRNSRYYLVAYCVKHRLTGQAFYLLFWVSALKHGVLKYEMYCLYTCAAIGMAFSSDEIV